MKYDYLKKVTGKCEFVLLDSLKFPSDDDSSLNFSLSFLRDVSSFLKKYFFSFSIKFWTMSGITDSDRTWTGGALNVKISSLEKWAAERFLPFFTNKFISDPTDSQYASEKDLIFINSKRLINGWITQSSSFFDHSKKFWYKTS